MAIGSPINGEIIDVSFSLGSLDDLRHLQLSGARLGWKKDDAHR